MLEKYQRNYLDGSGLVADGRDMGTKVFREANIKFYLTASVEKRAERRLNQLKDQGISANLPNLIQKLLLRDKADMERLISPLMPAKDAIIIDTSDISASEEVFNKTINIINKRKRKKYMSEDFSILLEESISKLQVKAGAIINGHCY
jgi:cytidylate kinase